MLLLLVGLALTGLAAVTQESRARASIAAADEMLRMLRGERPRNLVNPEVLT